jgi:hypothetical protein
MDRVRREGCSSWVRARSFEDCWLLSRVTSYFSRPFTLGQLGRAPRTPVPEPWPPAELRAGLGWGARGKGFLPWQGLGKLRVRWGHAMSPGRPLFPFSWRFATSVRCQIVFGVPSQSLFAYLPVGNSPGLENCDLNPDWGRFSKKGSVRGPYGIQLPGTVLSPEYLWTLCKTRTRAPWGYW